MPLWSARSLNIHVTLTSNAQNAALTSLSSDNPYHTYLHVKLVVL